MSNKERLKQDLSAKQLAMAVFFICLYLTPIFLKTVFGEVGWVDFLFGDRKIYTWYLLIILFTFVSDYGGFKKN